MSRCELCGRMDELVRAEVEGVDLSVCPSCAKHGTIRKPHTFSAGKFQSFRQEEPAWKVVSDFSLKLRAARQSKSLTQEEFAAFLNQRESSINKWELGAVKPSLDDAKEIGRRLGINLIEKEEETTTEIKQKKADDLFTIGDFVKRR